MVIIILCLYFLNYLYYHKKINQSLEEIKISKSLMDSYMTESIMAYESVKGQNLESQVEKQFINKNDNYINDLQKYEYLTSNMNLINNFISDISILIIFGVGLFLINNNAMTYGDLIIFYTISDYLLEPIKHFNELNLVVKEIIISLKRLINLKYFKDKFINKIVYGDIHIKKLNFDINDKKILSNLTLIFKKNENIMITGKSGCGKSTLLKLIKQFYKTDDIYINQTNIKNFNMNENITYISQNEYLFTNTLYNNITMGKEISSDELNKIINICELDDIVSNKMGLNMLIEENGFNLSGGEKQRIILARALVNLKDYLFRDEGLSEVNIDMERRILKKLFSIYKNTTILFVSHRLDNLDLFDKLVKLDKKQIIERR
jgi:ABC-type bacteriocin/lantibiotic exporter with double-glycine peptidase domain